MLNECRKALRITTEAYDGELCSLMDAGARDLAIAGVTLPGTVSFTLVSTTVGTSTVTYYQDDSTLADALVARAIFTYTRMHFGSPSDFGPRMFVTTGRGSDADTICTPSPFGGASAITVRSKTWFHFLNSVNFVPARRATWRRSVASTIAFARIACRPLRFTTTTPHTFPSASLMTSQAYVQVRNGMSRSSMKRSNAFFTTKGDMSPKGIAGFPAPSVR